jgi:hypothetical protein
VIMCGSEAGDNFYIQKRSILLKDNTNIRKYVYLHKIISSDKKSSSK